MKTIGGHQSTQTSASGHHSLSLKHAELKFSSFAANSVAACTATPCHYFSSSVDGDKSWTQVNVCIGYTPYKKQDELASLERAADIKVMARHHGVREKPIKAE
eukprot:scaffold70663_cov19-Prasinocladus_malaysianus.AAC.3